MGNTVVEKAILATIDSAHTQRYNESGGFGRCSSGTIEVVIAEYEVMERRAGHG
jgi:hypothetical protein